MTIKHQTQVTSPPKGTAKTPFAILHPTTAATADAMSTDGKPSDATANPTPCNTAMRTIDDATMTPFLRKVVLFSSGGSFLDGYVLALIGVALVQIAPHFNMSVQWSAAVGSSVMVGILVGTIAGGWLTDKLGRRKMFILDVVAIGGLSLLSAFVQDALQLVLLRFAIGVFVGADYPIATSLITEFMPKSKRSIGMGIVSGSWYLGATVASIVGFALFDLANGWQWMLGSAVIPCIILLVGRRDIPESPRWLMSHGFVQEAEQVCRKVFGDNVVLEEEEACASGFFHNMKVIFAGGYGKRVVYLGLLILCQVVPMYAIYTFGPQIMGAFGMAEGKQAILGENIISLMFLIGTIPAMFWLNSMGRRPLLIGSLACMAAGLLVLGIWPTAPMLIVVAAFGLYAFFSGGPGILQWLYPNELFPTSVRATAVGVAIGFSRIGTIAATYATPIFLNACGIGATMLVAAGLVLAALVLSVAMAPETKGKSLCEASLIKTIPNRCW